MLQVDVLDGVGRLPRVHLSCSRYEQCKALYGCLCGAQGVQGTRRAVKVCRWLCCAVHVVHVTSNPTAGPEPDSKQWQYSSWLYSSDCVHTRCSRPEIYRSTCTSSTQPQAVTTMDSSSMPPPPPRRKEDMRKDVLSSMLSAGPGNAPVLPIGEEAGAPQHATLGGAGQAADQHDLPDWRQYWDECKTMELPDRGGAFNVYCAGSTGPILLAVHGAGYTGLTWSLLASALKDRYRIVAPDLRGHGLTTAIPETDFSKQTLADDLCALWHALFPPPPPIAPADPATDTHTAPAAVSEPNSAIQTATGVKVPIRPTPASDPRATVLVGHSMGGAIVVWAAASKQIPSLAGCVVVDVVEGTAIAALPRMMSVIEARPTSFPSPAAAVHWAIKSGMSRCKSAAAISLPSQLHRQSQQPAPGPQPTRTLPLSNTTHTHTPLNDPSSTIREDEEEQAEVAGGEQQQQQEQEVHASDAQGTVAAPVAAQPAAAAAHKSSSGQGERWCWRTSLVDTQPYWHEWYAGHSDALLSLPVPKLLLLAGTDRLDKPLTIGQMQGKFQLVVLPTAGHAIQEDDTTATAAALDSFIKRQRIGQPPLAVPAPGVRPVLPIVAGPLFRP